MHGFEQTFPRQCAVFFARTVSPKQSAADKAGAGEGDAQREGVGAGKGRKIDCPARGPGRGTQRVADIPRRITKAIDERKQSLEGRRREGIGGQRLKYSVQCWQAAGANSFGLCSLGCQWANGDAPHQRDDAGQGGGRLGQGMGDQIEKRVALGGALGPDQRGSHRDRPVFAVLRPGPHQRAQGQVLAQWRGIEDGRGQQPACERVDLAGTIGNLDSVK